ncbi:MAG: hypothetical protein IK055_07295 [Lachnospiraceae bacterium]|nr:hypothetical protein [Lachnospiraceae bacterium]MBR6020002.1 hypothetical protein [Lachnospiraceae bacterium]
MTKKYQCPNCGVAMEFRPDTQEWHCEYCHSTFSLKELEKAESELAEALAKAGLGGTGETGLPAEGAESAEDVVADGDTTMQMTILRCQSCGAELAVDGTEASTFCAFCGQATVVIDRLEGWLKPDYIIPFQVTKEEAEKKIREKVSKGRFIPRKLRHFPAKRMRGIYIPFWLYDVYYADDAVWSYKKKVGKTYVTKSCKRAAECKFRDVPVDASKQMPDEASQRLEPYDMNGLKKFNPAYLSGFYSNRFDVLKEEATQTAVTRAGEMFDDRMEVEMKIDYPDGATKSLSQSVGEAINPRYALMPAWFVTFRQDDKPFNIMVNGQTGKVVCAMPFVKKKAIALLVFLLLLFCIPLGLFGGYAIPWMQNGKNEMTERIVFMLTFAFFIGCGVGCYHLFGRVRDMWDSLKENTELTNSEVTEQYVGERQDKSI